VKILRRTQFGNPILRSITQKLIDSEINSQQTQELIQNMRYTLENRKYGVGLAAPQVGESVSLSVIGIKPTPTRPYLKPEELVIINPKITKTYGAKVPMWEGCVSGGEIYGQVPRYEKVRLEWQDGKAAKHQQDFEGFIAQVIQHEVDHLNGILYMDRVVDPTTYMTFSEYKKMRNKDA
jgi:peptide deformylase